MVLFRQPLDLSKWSKSFPLIFQAKCLNSIGFEFQCLRILFLFLKDFLFLRRFLSWGLVRNRCRFVLITIRWRFALCEFLPPRKIIIIFHIGKSHGRRFLQISPSCPSTLFLVRVVLMWASHKGVGKLLIFFFRVVDKLFRIWTICTFVVNFTNLYLSVLLVLGSRVIRFIHGFSHCGRTNWIIGHLSIILLFQNP